MATHPGGARAPKKSLTEHVATQEEFLATQLQPALDAAVAGKGHVLFVDAAHFVFGTFLCCLWSIARVFVRAASGRQRHGNRILFGHKTEEKLFEEVG